MVDILGGFRFLMDFQNLTTNPGCTFAWYNRSSQNPLEFSGGISTTDLQLRSANFQSQIIHGRAILL